MHFAFCRVQVYLCGKPDVASGQVGGSGFALPDQAVQLKTNQGDARQDKSSCCVDQARPERCPLHGFEKYCRTDLLPMLNLRAGMDK